MESLEPIISLKTHPRKPKSSQWMENLNPLRTHFKNLDYKKERHKSCDLPLISSKVQSRTRGVNSTHNENSILSPFK
jgi:hypothetical protein